MIAKSIHSQRATILATFIFLLCGGISFAQDVPPPEEILGFKVGADFHLASYQQAMEYFKALEKASPRIKLFEMGKSTMGKPMIYAVITSVENMDKLNRFKEISRRLALAKDLTDEEALQLAAEGKAIVYIDGGLHATEVAPPQHNIQLAYDLVTSDEPDIRLIRENTVLLLAFPNPDGMDMVAEWYHSNLGTPYEISPMPWLYHKYVGHDNNRDSYMVNMVETQNLTRLTNHEWFPVIFYNQHQTGPFPTRIFVPPNAEPTNPNYHPLLLRGKNLIGSAMGFAFDREGKPGVVSRISYDLWYPGYVDQVGDFFNTISILTETNLYRYATPHFYTLNDFPEAYRDFTISSFYPNPWKGGWWRIGDAVDYCLTASKAVLKTAAKYREEFLQNKFKMGRDISARFQKEPPYAWIIPQTQWDPPTAALLLNKMILLGIEVDEAEEVFVSDGVSYPAGTWVIPMSQAFAYFIKTMFEEQSFPDLANLPALWQGVVRPQKFPGAYLPPYDMTGWTLSYQMGVKVAAANSPLKVQLSPLEKVVPPTGGIEKGPGYAYHLSPRFNNSFIAVNRILEKGGEVLWSRESYKVDGIDYPPGSYIILARSISRSFMDSLAREFHLTFRGAGSRAQAKTYKLKAPRIALYKSWVANMDEGWTRWLFEQFEFPFKNIHDAEIKAGGLEKKFDVLVIPAMSTDDIVNGHRSGTIRPQYAGGITTTGVKNIKRFVQEGGTLVTLNSGCLFAIDELSLPVRDALKEVRPPGRREARRQTGPVKFVCPGSLLRMNFDSKHPVAYGMPEESSAFFTRSPAFDIITSSSNASAVIARYADTNLIMSGYLLGEKYLKKKASAVEVSVGKGRVILLGFGVQSRAQPHGTFKLLFNSLLYAAAQ